MVNQTLFPGQRLIASYYAATALFLVLDYGLGINLRLSFLEEFPGWRLVYYLACALCFLLVWRFPSWSNVVAAAESLFNLSGLILHMGSRVLTVTDSVLESGRPPVTPDEIFNFLISGTVAYTALWLRFRRIREELRVSKSVD